jgi:surface protein
MGNMFAWCYDLPSLDLSNWDTSNVTYMGTMFHSCINLTTLDLSNFDTSNVTIMGDMFTNCNKLTSLDLSNFNIDYLTNTNYMFSNCNALHTLHLDNCNKTTIYKITSSKNFPTNAIEGIIRTIYCKESEAAGLTAPTNWSFSYID